MRRVVVLRPEPGASETMARAQALGLDAVSIPLFAVEPVAWDVPSAADFDGLLLTSANAIRHGGEQLAQLRGLKVYAVGKATADAARAAGFDVVATGDSGVERLLDSIELDLTLLHPGGEQRTDVSGDITPLVVYRATPIEHPDISGIQGSVILVHSPRVGRRLAELVKDRGASAIVAISEAAAQSVGAGWERIENADEPTDEALLALAARLCNKPPPE